MRRLSRAKSAARTAREVVLREATRVALPLTQRIGLSVVRHHFSEPVPDVRQLRARPFSSTRPMLGIDTNLAAQRERLEKFRTFHEEWTFPTTRVADPHAFYLNNGFFGTFDAEVLHAMIRLEKPRRIIEVGSGFTTRVSARAIRLNKDLDGATTELVAIEPFPRRVDASLPGLSRLIRQPLEDVPLETFAGLQAGDILFIDSSHVIRLGGDVLYLFTEILPRVPVGVFVHLHDIFLPSDYPPTWVLGANRFWTEQYLLQAFLAFNRSFEIVWASSLMHTWCPDALDDVFPLWRDSYLRVPPKQRRGTPTLDGRHVWPSSFWMRRVAS